MPENRVRTREWRYFVLLPLAAVVTVSCGRCDTPQAARSPRDAGVCLAAGSCADRKKRLAQIVSYLDSDNEVLRRRAAIALAIEGEDTNRIVDTVIADASVGDYLPCYLAITIVGKRALPRLYHHLADARTRNYALYGIALLGEPDHCAGIALQKLDECADQDVQLHSILQLLRSTRTSVNQPGGRPGLQEDSYYETGKELCWFYLASAAFRGTRDWSLLRIRKRTEAIISSATPDDYSEELLSLLLATGYAARHNRLLSQHIVVLESTKRSLLEHKMETLLPPVLMAKWLGTGRQNASLTDLLRALGKQRPIFGSRFQSVWICFFGDGFLPNSDIEVFVNRALDPKEQLPVRVGAVRLLGYLGPHERSVHSTFLRLLSSQHERIRYEASQALGMCVEPATTEAALAAKVKERLTVESSTRVVEQLNKAVVLLEAF